MVSSLAIQSHFRIIERPHFQELDYSEYEGCRPADCLWNKWGGGTYNLKLYMVCPYTVHLLGQHRRATIIDLLVLKKLALIAVYVKTVDLFVHVRQ